MTEDLCAEVRRIARGWQVVRTEYCVAESGHDGPCWFEAFEGDPVARATADVHEEGQTP